MQTGYACLTQANEACTARINCVRTVIMRACVRVCVFACWPIRAVSACHRCWIVDNLHHADRVGLNWWGVSKTRATDEAKRHKGKKGTLCVCVFTLCVKKKANYS
jgi:hypothetical protein